MNCYPDDTMFGEEMTEYSGGRISDEDGEDVTEGGSALDVMPSHEVKKNTSKE